MESDPQPAVDGGSRCAASLRSLTGFLYSTGIRLTLSLALARAGRVQLRVAENRIDIDLVAHHVYSEGKLKALQQGGVQNLHAENITTGRFLVWGKNPAVAAVLVTQLDRVDALSL